MGRSPYLGLVVTGSSAYGYTKVVQLLLQCPQLDRGDIAVALHTAVDEGHIEVVALIEYQQRVAMEWDIFLSRFLRGGVARPSGGGLGGEGPGPQTAPEASGSLRLDHTIEKIIMA